MAKTASASGSTTVTISWLTLCTRPLNFYTPLHRGKKLVWVFNMKSMSSTAKTCQHLQFCRPVRPWAGGWEAEALPLRGWAQMGFSSGHPFFLHRLLRLKEHLTEILTAAPTLVTGLSGAQEQDRVKHLEVQPGAKGRKVEGESES